MARGRMARTGYRLPKVSLGTVISYPSMPCGWVTSETALHPFKGSPAHRAGGLESTSTLLDTPRRTPMEETFQVQAEGKRCLHFRTR
jgi:hypothetical protein